MLRMKDLARMTSSQGRRPARTPSVVRGIESIPGKVMARAHERNQVQNQVQRAPGRLAVRALNLEFSYRGKGPKGEKVERQRNSGEKNMAGLGKSLNHYHQLRVAGWSDRAGLLDGGIRSMPDTPLP